jgi:DNA-binding MarR family transcriptional regulator
MNACPACNAASWPGSRPKTSARGGTMAASHMDLVKALAHDKGNLSTSLKGLEAKGLVTIARPLGGMAQAVDLTVEGRKWVARLTGSCE